MAEDTDNTEHAEFWMVCETGDIETFDDYEALTSAVERDIEKHGEETARESGVIHPYGYTIHVMRNGRVATEDWEREEPHKPLSMS
ncbi:hypothetical protein ACWGJ2_40130 [Streptomyces sp. NPDC054796]